MFDYLFIFASSFFILTILFLSYNILIGKNNVLKSIYENKNVKTIENDFLNIEILNFNDFYDIHIKNVDKNVLQNFLKLLKFDDESIKILNQNKLLEKND